MIIFAHYSSSCGRSSTIISFFSWSIPLISKLSDSIKELDDNSLYMLEKDIQTAHIYESIVANKFSQPFRNEFQQKLVIL